MEAMEVSCRSRNAFCLRGSQHALPALPGPMGNANMAQSWEGSSKFGETPREVEAEASFGKGPKTHRRGRDVQGARVGAPCPAWPRGPCRPWRWTLVGSEGRERQPPAGQAETALPQSRPRTPPSTIRALCHPHSSLQPLQPPQEIFLHDTMLKGVQPHPAVPTATGEEGQARAGLAGSGTHSPSQQYPRWYHLARL